MMSCKHSQQNKINTENYRMPKKRQMLNGNKGTVKETNLEGKRTYLAYVLEGLWKSQDWEMVFKYQRKNESLFNSPSTTAAAFTHLKNSGCLSYLQSLLDKFGDAGPSLHPCL